MHSEQIYQDEKLLQYSSRLKKINSYQYQQHPFNCIGAIVCMNQHQKIHATGFLISSCLVLTSAHTFYSIERDKTLISHPKVFNIQINGTIHDQQSIKVTNYRFSQKYKASLNKVKELTILRRKLANEKLLPMQQLQQQLKRIDQQCLRLRLQTQKYDYALLKLQKIVQRESYFQLQIPGQRQQRVTVCGYLPRLNEEYFLYQHSNQLIVENDLGFYDIDTEPGQSGSTVFLERDKSIVIGIHKGFFKNKSLNSCCLVSDQMIQQLMEWQKEFNLENVRFDNFNNSNRNEQFQRERENLRNQVQKIKVENSVLSKQLQSKTIQILKMSQELSVLRIYNKNLQNLNNKYFAQKRQLQLKLAKESQQFQSKLKQASQIIDKLKHSSGEIIKVQEIKHLSSSQIIKYDTPFSNSYKAVTQNILRQKPKNDLKIVEKTYRKLLQHLKSLPQTHFVTTNHLQICAGCTKIYLKRLQICFEGRLQPIIYAAVNMFGSSVVRQIRFRKYLKLYRDDIIQLANLLARFKNLKTLHYEFRHGIIDWDCFYQLAEVLNSMNLDQINLRIDKNFEQYTKKENWTQILTAKRSIMYISWAEHSQYP